MRTLNLGILAHVDAGKTTLTERLLLTAGAIDEAGSVDAGTSHTDTLALEQRRGITIRSAVAAFRVDDVAVNLIDTPGHSDFIAEVERALTVLDGAVLVLSAVEGVQPQTRILLHTLQRLRVPTVLLVNKIDRSGADPDRAVRQVEESLTPAVVPLTAARHPGGPGAGVERYADPHPPLVPSRARLLDVLTRADDGLLADWVEDAGSVDDRRLRHELGVQTRRGLVHPLFVGSARTGEGVGDLVAGLVDLLPGSDGEAAPDRPAGETGLSAAVFKIERGDAGEKVAHVRVFAGELRVRTRLQLPAGPAKVTGLQVLRPGGDQPTESVGPGDIARVRGLSTARVGDVLGTPLPGREHGHRFPPPSLEAVVVPCRPGDRAALHTALTELAEQDPLISVRLPEGRRGGDLHVSLYGEVQREVLAATLAEEYGPGSLPPAFFTAVEEGARRTLRRGPNGWVVPDARVVVTHSGYWARQSHSHGTFDASMSSTAGDFRGLTRRLLVRLMARAGTRVEEPVHRF
ncbi:MAG TPA: GTP-binding protein, partial [Segeticoccus sp.]|nr:GTP-binding protein [Segeticoccus sp.]